MDVDLRLSKLRSACLKQARWLLRERCSPSVLRSHLAPARPLILKFGTLSDCDLEYRPHR